MELISTGVAEDHRGPGLAGEMAVPELPQGRDDRCERPSQLGEVVPEAGRALLVLDAGQQALGLESSQPRREDVPGAPVKRAMSSKRWLPSNNSRMTRRVHFAPTSSSVRAIEQTRTSDDMPSA